MNRKYFLELADYNLWANNIAIEWLKQINNEQWEQITISSFSSIRQTAIHIASAGKIWIDYWEKVPAPVFLSLEFKGTKNDLIEIWEKSSLDLKNLIDKYPEENYHKPVAFKWPGGADGKMEFWQSFAHMLNHSTYHRGQMVTLFAARRFYRVFLQLIWLLIIACVRRKCL